MQVLFALLTAIALAHSPSQPVETLIEQEQLSTGEQLALLGLKTTESPLKNGQIVTKDLCSEYNQFLILDETYQYIKRNMRTWREKLSKKTGDEVWLQLSGMREDQVRQNIIAYGNNVGKLIGAAIITTNPKHRCVGELHTQWLPENLVEIAMRILRVESTVDFIHEETVYQEVVKIIKDWCLYNGKLYDSTFGCKKG